MKRRNLQQLTPQVLDVLVNRLLQFQRNLLQYLRIIRFHQFQTKLLNLFFHSLP